MNTKNFFSTAKEYLIMSLASLIIAVAVYFFLVPTHTSISSISGLAIVLENFIPLSMSAITMILNVFLLILGFIFCGNEFGARTVFNTIIMPLYLKLFETIFPNVQSFTGNNMLDVIAYIFIVSIGIAILFNMNASSGGLDIVAKIMNKYLHMDLGHAMSISGMIVALSSALVYDKETVVLSVIGTYFNGILIDHFVFGQKIKRRVCIISKDKEAEIHHWIINDLKSGATIYQARGAHDGIIRNEIITIVDKTEYQKLMSYLVKNAPEAFVTVYNVNEVRYVPKNIKAPGKKSFFKAN